MFGGSRQRVAEETLLDRIVSLENVVGMNLPRISVCENNLSTLFAKIEGVAERVANAEARIPLSDPLVEPMATDVPSEHSASPEPTRATAPHR